MENIKTIEPMEEKKQASLFRNSLNFGLYTSAGFIVISMLFYALDVDRTGWINYLTFIILIIGIIIGTKSFRDKNCGGYLSYGRSLGSGVIISLVVGVIMAVFTFLFYQYFDPSELQKIVEIAEQNMADQGLTDDQIEQAMSFSKMFMSPVGMSVSMVFGMAFWGTIFSLIIAIFLKKNDDSFNAM